MSTTSLVRPLAAACLILAMVFGWWAAARTGVLPRAFVPGPLDAWNAALVGFTEGDLAEQTLATVWRMIHGCLLASACGVLIGSCIGISASARRYLQPMLEFLRPMPASAIIPIAIAFFGLSPAMALAVIVFGSIWPTLLSTVHGFASVDKRLFEVADCLQMSRISLICKIALPNAVPDILSGVRLSLTVSLILAVVCEMLAAQPGLGTAILLASRSFQSANLFAGMILLGLIGFVSDVLLQLVERRLLAWKR